MAAGHLPAAVAEFQRATRLDPVSRRSVCPRSCLARSREPDKAMEILRPIGRNAIPARAKGGAQDCRSARHENRRTRARQLCPSPLRSVFLRLRHAHAARARLSCPRHLASARRPCCWAKQPASTFWILAAARGCAARASGSGEAARWRRPFSAHDRESAQPRNLRRALVSDIQACSTAMVRPTICSLAPTRWSISAIWRRSSRAPPSGCGGGFLFFTVERKEGEGYALGEKRRYRHSEAYLRMESSRAGFDVMGLMRVPHAPKRTSRSTAWP